MYKLNRSWTLQLQINKEMFSNAFFKVVTKDNKFVLQSFSLANNIEKDFFGTISNDTFTIWKRRGIFDPNPNSIYLNGEIISTRDSLNLNLELSNKYAYNYIKLFVSNVIIAAILFLLVTRMLWATHLLSDKLTSVYLFVSIPTLFLLSYYFLKKIIEMYLNWLIDLYNEVLKRIERQSN
jgi:membrane-associated HD superfamily phosphohydrolase